MANTCACSELGIYIYLFRVIRQKNNESLQSGVINNKTRQERKQKNLIHLSGQFTCFLVQFLGAMSIQVVSFLAPVIVIQRVDLDHLSHTRFCMFVYVFK